MSRPTNSSGAAPKTALDFFFYGIHGIEALFTLMGTGCETVSRVKGRKHDLAIGTWKDGRIGSYRGILTGKADFGAVAYGSKSIGQTTKYISRSRP